MQNIIALIDTANKLHRYSSTLFRHLFHLSWMV